MQRIGIIGGVALAALVAASAAEARCAEDLDALQTRIYRSLKQHPTAQGYAAAKILQKYQESPSSDEVSCFNALARARQAFTASTPPQEAQEAAPPGQPVQPVQPLNQQH